MQEKLYGNVVLTVIAAALLVLIWQQHTISRNVDSISNRNFDQVDLQRVMICNPHGDCPNAISVSGTVAVTNESLARFSNSSIPLAVKVVEMPISIRWGIRR